MSGQKDKTQLDVEFAYMPYSKLSHPALGASILKKCLEEEGINSKISYYSIDFAEVIGTKPYTDLLLSSTPSLVGEWTFSYSAFGDSFIDNIAQKFPKATPKALANYETISRTAKEWINSLAEAISIEPPKILICSSMFQQNVASLAILRAVKKRCPSIYTIMGGPNTEGVLGLGLLRRAPWLDYICAGEGEETLPQLCKMLIHGECENQKPIGVLGQRDIDTYKGQFQINGPRPTLDTMAKSPNPCFDDYFNAIKKTSIKIRPGLLLESSRGCWWGQRSQCTFCGLNGEGMAYRAHDAKQMAERVHAITAKHEIKRVEFVDNIISKKYFTDFLPLVNKEDLSIFYETKADFSEADAKQFHESGVRFIQPGIESLSDEVLLLMKKGTTAALNLECLRLCREYGLNPAWTILCGFPGEREEWYKETIELLPKLFHLRPPNSIMTIRYDRFSPYHDHPEMWGLELEPYEAYKMVYPDYHEQFTDIAYFFKKKGMADEESSPALPSDNKNFKRISEIINQWKEYWKFMRKHTGEQPQLTLIKKEDYFIYDDRKPNKKPTYTKISDPLVQLLMVCRKRHRKESLLKLNEKYPAIYANIEEIRSQLRYAENQGWLINIGGSVISVVQYRNDQHQSDFYWPGGRVTQTTGADELRLYRAYI